GDPYPQRVRAALDVGQDGLPVGRLLPGRLRLDDHQVLLAVPGQPHRADPELLVHRRLQRLGVGGLRGVRQVLAHLPFDLVHQLPPPTPHHPPPDLLPPPPAPPPPPP